MKFWMEVLSGCLGSIVAGLFFVFWYAIFQCLLQSTDILVSYNWSWKGIDYHPNFDIRNRSKSRTYLLANVVYSKDEGKILVGIDNKSFWGFELKPGSINHFDAIAPVREVHSMPDCLQVQVRIRVQTGREFPATGPGQDKKRVMRTDQRFAHWLRDLFDKNSIPME
jgi:hypothetical protein